jgi:hypothetical protein
MGKVFRYRKAAELRTHPGPRPGKSKTEDPGENYRKGGNRDWVDLRNDLPNDHLGTVLRGRTFAEDLYPDFLTHKSRKTMGRCRNTWYGITIRRSSAGAV